MFASPFRCCQQFIVCFYSWRSKLSVSENFIHLFPVISIYYLLTHKLMVICVRLVNWFALINSNYAHALRVHNKNYIDASYPNATIQYIQHIMSPLYTILYRAQLIHLGSSCRSNVCDTNCKMKTVQIKRMNVVESCQRSDKLNAIDGCMTNTKKQSSKNGQLRVKKTNIYWRSLEHHILRALWLDQLQLAYWLTSE